MIVTIFFRENSSSELDAKKLGERLEEYQVTADSIDADGVRGQQLSELYDIVDFPAVLVTDETGTEITKWQGQLPEPGQVSYFAHS